MSIQQDDVQGGCRFGLFDAAFLKGTVVFLGAVIHVDPLMEADGQCKEAGE